MDDASAKTPGSNGVNVPAPPSSGQFVVCADNAGYPASLEQRKIYPVIRERGLPADLIRVVDESGEGYLYPVRLFEPIWLSTRMRAALKPASYL